MRRALELRLIASPPSSAKSRRFHGSMSAPSASVSMAEMSHDAQPVASTSQAAAEPEASPPPPAEQEQFSMADLFTADDIVDSLVTAVEKEDVAACVSHLSQLRLRQQEKLVNQPRAFQVRAGLEDSGRTVRHLI